MGLHSSQQGHDASPTPASTFLFTSESVGEGHPDKLCDQISDAILDACLGVDPLSRVAVEVAVKTGMVLAFGEVTSRCRPDYPAIIRRVVRDVGYDRPELGFHADSINVLTAIEHQSPDIAQSLDGSACLEAMAAGDQGSVFGYATDETQELMPLSLMLAHKLVKRVAEARRGGVVPWLRPDCKAQVTVEYCKDDGGGLVPVRVHTVVLSCQHDPLVDTEEIRRVLLAAVVREVVDAQLLDARTVYHIQPSGRFVVGGPVGDAGLTGRKIIVDTYGGWGAHGGGAFSGKDWSKVDRSAAYAARWVAKSLVASGLCRRCLVQVSYAIGVPEPLAVYIDTFGSAKHSESALLQLVHDCFDLRPGVIVQQLGLSRPIFQATACYGHFGWSEYPWERARMLSIETIETKKQITK